MTEALKHDLRGNSCPAPAATPLDYGQVRSMLRELVGRRIKALPMNQTTATQQLNGRLDVSLRLVDAVGRLSGRAEVWGYLAQSNGALWVPADRPHGPEALKDLLVSLGSEVGDVFRKAQQALSDGRVTPAERRALAKEIHEASALLVQALRAE